MSNKKVAVAISKMVNKELAAEGMTVRTEYVSVTKNNGVLMDGLRIHEEGSESKVQPVIYFDGQILKYTSDTEDVKDLVMNVWNNSQPKFDAEMIGSKDYIMENVRPILVSGLNKKRFYEDGILCTPFTDLLVTYRVFIDFDKEIKGVMGSYLLTRKHLEAIDTTVGEIFGKAIHNMVSGSLWRSISDNSNHHAVMEVISLTKMLHDMMPNDPMFAAALAPEDCPIYVVTNKEKQYGASILLTQGNREELLQIFDNKDLIAIPSSIHEWLVMPRESMDEYGMLADMIKQVNETELAKEDILSNHPYYILADTAELVEHDMTLPF